MPVNVATPIEPADFPWYDYRGFTFSLGLQVDGHVLNSGHSGSAFDPIKGKPDVTGGMAEQAQIAYAKQAAVLAAAGLSIGDVTRVVENVTIDGLAHYAGAEQVRRTVFAGHEPVVVTVVVDRLVRRKALIEVEVHASPAGGPALVLGGEGRWRRGTVREGHDGAVYLPTMLPLDAAGELVASGDIAGQYAYCLQRAGELLDAAGLSIAQVVSTVDYSTPATREEYPRTARARRDLLGPVYPTAAGILMSRLHEPGVLVAVDVVASRHTPIAVNPGWSRYETLTYNPGVRAGNTLYMSGFASLDMRTQQAMHAGDLRGQAEQTYGAIRQTMDAAGASQLLSTVEYVTPGALPAYREVAEVRRALLREPYPTSTGIVCGGLLRPEFLLEVVPSALIPGSS
ncbi:MAG: RidA family protein [Jatrophihabitantaceae bacterium]